jgi:hypothetical protein
MKLAITLLFALLLFISCGVKKDIVANQKFDKNSKTVLNYIEGFQNQNVDYTSYSKVFKSLNTSFGETTETITLDEFKESNKKMFEVLQFKLIETPVFLRGVDAKTGVIDGSVRFYGTWEITLKKTATTESKTARLKVYESLDFDTDGKIVFQQGYGDFTGLIMFLTNK